MPARARTAVPARLWPWALVADGLGVWALVLGLRVANRLVALPDQQLPDFGRRRRSPS